MKTLQIKKATPHDREILIQLFLEYLQFVDQFESEALPTRKNAEWMTDQVFLPAASRGDPILVAREGDQVVGGLFWVIQQQPIETRWKSALGYATYIREEYRSKKAGSLLREEGLKILKGKGIERLFGAVHFGNKISIKASDRLGAKPYARIDIFEL